VAYGYDYVPASACENCPYNMMYGQYSEPYMAEMYHPNAEVDDAGSSGESGEESKDEYENMYRQPPFFPRPFFPRPFFPGPFFPGPFFPRPFFPRPFFFPPFPFFF
jgi:hypothetical protein